MPEIARSVRHDATRPGLARAMFGYLRARRALLPFLVTVGYVAGLGVRGDRGQGGRAWLLGVVALALAYAASSPALPGNGLGEDGQRRVGPVALSVWGLALTLASIAGRSPDLVADFFGEMAGLGVSVTAARALGNVRGRHGVAASLPAAPRGLLVGTIALLLLMFGVALAASVVLLRDRDATPHDPLSHDAHAVAAGGAVLLLTGYASETLRTHRLVLDAGDRALAALGSILAVAVMAAAALVLGQAAPDRILRLAVAIAALLVTVAATEGDAVNHLRRGRRALTLLIFGGPVVLTGGLAAEGPGGQLPALLVTATVALLIGSVARALEQPLRRAAGRLLDAVERARLALVRADPETSMRDALVALRTFAGPGAESPELWSLSCPPRVLTIDGAGYPRERGAPAPQHLIDIALGELEATVRAELLEALVVRRPDLRPLARWMDERGALSGTLVTREGEVEGVLVLPRGARREPLSLEEVRAVKGLADAFSGAMAAASLLSRSLEREERATKRAEEVGEILLAEERSVRMASERDRLVTARLAEEAMGGPYSPSARVGWDTIERRVRLGAPLVVVAPNGSNVVSYLARAHITGPRARMPFVVVDGAKTSEHDALRWADATQSPLALAERGLLVIADAAARLPRSVQQLIADALAQRRAPWEGAGPLDVSLALTTAGAARTMHDDLDLALVARLGDALAELVLWPHLRERGEDLRSLVLAGLAREGVRTRGAPLGIEDAAFEDLSNYEYPGEDAELASIVKRLSLVASGDVVTRGDVRSLGLGPETPAGR